MHARPHVDDLMNNTIHVCTVVPAPLMHPSALARLSQFRRTSILDETALTVRPAMPICRGFQGPLPSPVMPTLAEINPLHLQKEEMVRGFNFLTLCL